MTNRNLFINSFFSLSFLSCEKDCKLQPIPSNVFDLNKIQDTMIFINKNEIESIRRKLTPKSSK